MGRHSWTIGLLATLSASPALAAGVSIAVTDLKARGVDPVAAGALTTEVTNTLSQLGVFSVISGEDIKRLLTLEATRQACTGDADAACLAEIGGALGVDYLVYGEVAKLGDTFSISLSLLDTARASAMGRANAKVERANALLTETERLAKVLVRPLLEANRGFLVVQVSEAGAKIAIDGRLVGVSPLSERVQLAMGPHEVVVEKAGFITAAQTADVTANKVKVDQVTLVPNQAFIGDYESTAAAVRGVAWATTVLGVAGLGAAGALRLIADARFDELVSKRHLEQGGVCAEASTAFNRTDYCPTELGRANGVADEVGSIEGMDTGALVAAIGGGVSAVVGVVLFLTGDAPGRYATYSAGPSAAFGPGGVDLMLRW